MPADLQKARELFLHAVGKLPPEQWDGYVREACGGDTELERQVGYLLQVHREVGSFLERPAAAVGATGAFLPVPGEEVAAVPLSERPGTVIGPYKLLEQIGEGGFGVVFLAQQTQPVRRQVALKVLKPGMDTRQVVARFEAERQALALMNHPNIARVLDGGQTRSGRPYFVMDLVKGLPITEYCDQAKLTPRERLELFVPLCQAVQHAHQKGIIHRDLKPSNVLVAVHDTYPVVKVIDFGVAKALGQELTDKTLFTGFAQMIGTPLYMSPEQAGQSSLDVDTRSDTYSLGVLLYELLTGTTPFDKERLRTVGYDEIRRVIREEEPLRPSTRISTLGQAKATVSANRKSDPKRLGQLMRGELDWIVMKALEKDRNRRYETANGFAMDVQRYLAGEPVLAAPASHWYRLRKFVRRNRGSVIAASLVLLVLVFGVIGTTVGMFEANRAAAAERQATNHALEQKHLAEQAVEQERQAKAREAQRADGEQKEKVKAERNLAFARKANEILGAVFAALDPTQIAESGRPLQDVLRENLSRAVKELEGSAIGDPLEVAAMQNNLGLSLLGLGEYALAIEVFGKALQTRQAQLGADHPDTLTSKHNLAAGYQAAWQLDKALPLYRETLQLMKPKLGPDHPTTLTTMNNLAMTYEEAGQLDKALPLLEKTFELTKAKLGLDHPNTLGCMNNLAMGYQAAWQLDKALPLFRETLQLRQDKLGADHPDTLISMNNLAAGYQAAWQLDKALPLFRETLQLMKVKLGPDHPRTLATMNTLAGCYKVAGQLNLALPLFEETLKLRQAKFGPDHPRTLATMNELAGGYMDARQLDKALPLYQETLQLRKVKRGPDHPNTLGSMNDLALCYQVARQFDKALPLYQETLELMKEKLGPDHPITLATMNNLGMAYQEDGQLDKALPLLKETLELTEAKRGPDHPNTLGCMNNLGVTYWRLKRLDQSIPLFERTLPLQEKLLGRQRPQTQLTVANLGVNYLDAGRLREALPLLEEAYRASRKYPNLSWVARSLQNAYARTGEIARLADLLLEQLHAARKTLPRDSPELARRLTDLLLEQLPETRKTLPRDGPELAKRLAQIGWGLLEQKRWAEAEPLLRESLTIRAKTQPDAWNTFSTQAMFGGALLGQKKYADAEPHLRKGYAGMKQREKLIPSVAKKILPEAIDRLIELYTVTNRPDEVKQWRAERAKYPSAKK